MATSAPTSCFTVCGVLRCFTLALLLGGASLCEGARSISSSLWQQTLDNAFISSVFEGPDGHTYTAGKFSDTVKFSKPAGVGAPLVTRATSGVFEGFAAKYRSEDGVLVWAIMLGEGTDPAILGWQPAAASGGGGGGGGALVLAGTRERGSSVVIGEGATARTLPAAAARAGFVAVISAQGEVRGALQLAQPGISRFDSGDVSFVGGDVHVDGSVTVAGYSTNSASRPTAAFDAGENGGSSAVKVQCAAAHGTDATCGFVARLDAALVPQWATPVSAQLSVKGTAAAFYDDGSVLACGSFDPRGAALSVGVADLGVGVGVGELAAAAATAVEETDVWVVRLAGATGAPIWTTRIGGQNSTGQADACAGAVTQPDGSAALVGRTSGALVFFGEVRGHGGFNVTTRASSTNYAENREPGAAFVAGLNSSGAFTWVVAGQITADAAFSRCSWLARAKQQVKAAGLIAGGLGQYFRGSYATKGLYCYNNGTFDGHCYFGTGGTPTQEIATPEGSYQYRLAPAPPVDVNKCVPQLEDGTLQERAWGNGALGISKAVDGSYMVAGSFQHEVSFDLVAPVVACSPACGSGKPCGNTCLSLASSCSKALPGTACAATLTLDATGTQDAFFLRVSQAGAVLAAYQAGGASEATGGGGTPIDQYRVWASASPVDGSFAYGGIGVGTFSVGTGGSALRSKSEHPYASYFAKSGVDGFVVVPATPAPTPVPPTPPTPPTPMPTFAPTPEPTPAPTPENLPYCRPAHDGTCTKLPLEGGGNVHVCEGANKFFEWSRSGKSIRDPYPDQHIECGGWAWSFAGGGGGIRNAFGQFGIVSCSASTPMKATREHLFKHRGMCYKGYFNCRQCRWRLPTPAPTPVQFSKAEDLYLKVKGGDTKAIVLSSVALFLLLCAICFAVYIYRVVVGSRRPKGSRVLTVANKKGELGIKQASSKRLQL